MKKSLGLRSVILAALAAMMPACLIALILLDRSAAQWVRPVDGKISIQGDAMPLALEADWRVVGEDSAQGEILLSTAFQLDMQDAQQRALMIRSSYAPVGVNVNGRLWTWDGPELLAGTTVVLPQQIGPMTLEVVLRNPAGARPPLLLAGSVARIGRMRILRVILITVMLTLLLTGAAMMLLNYLLQGREMAILALWLTYMLLLVSQVDMLLPQSQSARLLHETAMLLLSAALCCTASLRLEGRRDAAPLAALLALDVGMALAWLIGFGIARKPPLFWLALPVQELGFLLTAWCAARSLWRDNRGGRAVNRLMDIAILLQLAGLVADTMLERSRLLMIPPVLVFSCVMAGMHLWLAARKQAEDRRTSEALERQLEQRVQARTEELRVANEQLSRIDACRSEFFSHIAHDLQSPLTIIRGSLDLVIDGTPITGEDREGYLNMAKSSAAKLTNRIKALRSLALMEEAVFEPRMQPLRPLLEQYAESCRALHVGKGLTFICEGEDISAMFDATWLQNALEHLVSNAVRYTPAGGSITLAWKRRMFGVELSVRDTGCGIAESDIPTLFDKFYQGWNSQEGFGIGLAVVQRVTQRHGGRVQAESVLGKGANFTLFFPDLPANAWDGKTAAGE
jgi:signal transduction histidine kinase